MSCSIVESQHLVEANRPDPRVERNEQVGRAEIRVSWQKQCFVEVSDEDVPLSVEVPVVIRVFQAAV